jgi:hypothetical protein
MYLFVKFRFLILLFSIFLLSPAICQEKVDNWLYYDQQRNIYLPANSGQEYSSLHAIIPYREKNKIVSLGIPANTSLFIQKKIIDYSYRNNNFLWNLDSLFNYHQTDSIFLSIYNPSISSEDLELVFLNQSLEEKPATGFLSFFKRSIGSFRDFFISGLILILILLVILNNAFPKTALFYFDVGKAFATGVREEQTNRMNLFQPNNILAITLHSLTVSLLFLTILKFNQIPPAWLDLDGFGPSVLSWFKAGVFLFGTFILKYLMISLFTMLFGLNMFANRHFFEFLRISIIFYGIVMILFLILWLGFQIPVGNIVESILIIIIFALILRTFLLFMKFINTTSFKNLYLFSYLCATEIIPLLIGFKILMF